MYTKDLSPKIIIFFLFLLGLIPAFFLSDGYKNDDGIDDYVIQPQNIPPLRKKFIKGKEQVTEYNSLDTFDTYDTGNEFLDSRYFAPRPAHLPKPLYTARLVSRRRPSDLPCNVKGRGRF